MGLQGGHVGVGAVDVVLVEVVDEGVVGVHPHLVVPGGPLLDGQAVGAVEGHPALQHAAHQRPVVGHGGLEEPHPRQHGLGLRLGAFHHPGVLRGDEHRVDAPVLVALEQHRVVAHLSDVPKKVVLGIAVGVGGDVGQVEPRVGRGQMLDGLEVQVQVHHRHVGHEGMGRLGDEALHHLQRIVVHQGALLQKRAQIVLVVVDGPPVPGEYIAGIEDAKILQDAVRAVHRFVDERADVVMLVLPRLKGQQ